MTAIKFGMWGTGRIGKRHSRFFANEQGKYELVAVCDLQREQFGDLVDQFQCAGYEDPDAFLANKDMELVIISTFSLLHVEHAARALAAGKLVLLDKPIAVTTSDYERLQKLVKEYPGKLFFLHNLRFTPSFQHIQRIIATGILGDVQMARICWSGGFHRRADWQTLLEYGAGQLSVWGPHTIDWGLQFTGWPVKEAWGHLKHVHSLGDADDHVDIMLVGENDVVASVQITDAAALPPAIYTIYGSRGSLVCPNPKEIQLKYLDPEFKFADRKAKAGFAKKGGFGEDEVFPWREETVSVEPAGSMWDLIEVAIANHLYDAIRKGIPFPISTASALEVVRITESVKKQNSQFDWRQ